MAGLFKHTVNNSTGQPKIAHRNGSPYVHTYEVKLPGPVASFSQVGQSSTTNYGGAPQSSVLDCSIGGPSWQIDFNWTPPLDNGGSPIIDYVIRRVPLYFNGGSTASTYDRAGTNGLFYADDGTNVNSLEYSTKFISDYDYCTSAGSNTLPTPYTGITGNSLTVTGYRAGHYAYQIAAVNEKGIGEWYPNNPYDASTENVGWTKTGQQAGSHYVFQNYSNSGHLGISYTVPSYPAGVSSSTSFSSMIMAIGKLNTTGQWRSTNRMYNSGFPGSYTTRRSSPRTGYAHAPELTWWFDFHTGGVQINYQNPTSGWYAAWAYEWVWDNSTKWINTQNGAHLKPVYITV